MSERNTTQKQPQKGKKSLLFIILAAVLVVGLVLLCVLLARCDGTNPEPTDPATDPVITDTTAPEEELLSFPCKIWDMEKLPESLVDAGMAYANSNENIYGNVILGGFDGKGVAGSRAFGYSFEGDYSDGDLFILDVTDEAQTMGTHWHPIDIESAVRDITEFMEGKQDDSLDPFLTK